jgi:hypothetical protein
MSTARKATTSTPRVAKAPRRRSLLDSLFPVDYNPPRNIFDIRRRRYRAWFFFLLGVVSTLAVQAFLARMN